MPGGPAPDDAPRARRRVLLVTLAVALVLGAGAWHAAAHERAGAPLAAWQTTFLALVGMVAPFLAVVLLWGRRWQAGALLLGASMLASLAYSLGLHYADRGGARESVASVEGEAAGLFRLTALLLVAAQSLALAAAGWLLREAAPAKPRRARRRQA